MQINEIVNEGLKRHYTVVIEATELAGRTDSYLDKLRGQIRMPGFRPGKVPMALIKRLHGDAVQGQVLEETINETTQKLLSEHKLRPAMQPNVEVVRYAAGEALEYKVELEILPQIATPDLSGLSFERMVSEVSDEQVDEMLTRLAAQQKSFEDAPKTRRAKAGDAVLIDFVGKIDDVAFEGGTAEGYQLELGSGSFIPGFEDQLIGVKTGDQLKVEVNFPENYGTKELAGKPATFDVTVHAVKTSAEAKLDDQLAQNLGLDDLAALRGLIRQQIEREHAQLGRAQVKRSLLDALAAQFDFEVPAGMVQAEFEQVWQSLLGQSSDDEKAALEADDKEKTDYRNIAERRVRLGLLLAQIGQDNQIEVRAEEVTRLISQEAQRYPGQEKAVFDYYRKNPSAMAQLRAPLYEDKVVDFILELAKVTEKKVDRATLEAALADDGVSEEKAPAKKKPAKAKADDAEVEAEAPAKKPAKATKAKAKPKAKE